jgi:hypothetical protein
MGNGSTYKVWYTGKSLGGVGWEESYKENRIHICFIWRRILVEGFKKVFTNFFVFFGYIMRKH